MKKRSIIIISVIVAAFLGLMIFSRKSSARQETEYFSEVKRGPFEISVSSTGELIAEKSLDIAGPDLMKLMMNAGGGGGRGGRGANVRSMDQKIQDIVPEGTIVSAGDYIAQLDRSSYTNTLKDAQDALKTQEDNLAMKILDTAVVLTNLRDEIKNQKYTVEEAKITLDQSKYEPPATIRQAEISLDKAQRNLQQKIKSYDLKRAQTLSEIKYQKTKLDQQRSMVQSLVEFLGGFTIKAPASGMIIYKKERNGSKRKAGSNLNPFDNVVATLPDLSTMISKVYVNEIEVSKVKPGQKVNVTVDAFPDKAYTGTVYTVANIGEQLPNSDAKMFEVEIKLNGADHTLRPSMTTTNKIIIKSFDDVTYIPNECVMAGADSIPFVYEKNKTKRFVVVGESNDKDVIVEQGLQPGKFVYTIPPENVKKFRIEGEDLIAITRQRNREKRMQNELLTKVSLQNKQAKDSLSLAQKETPKL
jgi:hypothetical protein